MAALKEPVVAAVEDNMDLFLLCLFCNCNSRVIIFMAPFGFYYGYIFLILRS